VEKKTVAWAIEDAIDRLEEDAARESSDARISMHAAIEADSECAEARAALADMYWEEFLKAEAARDSKRAAFYRRLVEATHEGRYAERLEGNGKLSLQTSPAGAEAVLYRYVLEKRVLIPREPRHLGKTPLSPVTLPMGSYLLVLRREGYRDVRYPLVLGRAQDHAGRVHLYTEAEVGADFIYVPAGELLRGGDRESYGGAAATRVMVEDFFIGRFPITMGQYCEFLDALLADGAEVKEHIPRQAEEVYVELGPDGRHRFCAVHIVGETRKRYAEGFERNHPVLGITWNSAMAYARWRSRRDGREYTLPPEDAWEKAARGSDGRFYPWGDYFDWTFTKGGLSRPERAQPEPVGAFPADESPYGVRDLAGTIREWTSDWFNEGQGLRAVRGGSWNLVVPRHFRCATRFGYNPAQRATTFGFRLFTREKAPARR
jgi:serine/threonine-protein kinase